VACHSGKLGSALVNVNPSLISTAVVLAIQTVILAMKAASGEITWRQMAQETSRAAALIAGATAGAAIGQAAIPVPILGALIGSLVGSVVAAIVYAGAGKVCVGVFRETEWTLFGLVEQNYTLPNDVLKEMDLELAEIDEVQLDAIELDTVELDTIELDQIEFRVLRRGVLEFARFGYV
jgi:hypothetical protein